MKNLTPENLLDALVDFADNLKFSDLPRPVVHEAKRRVIDSLACAVAGRKDPAAELMRNFMLFRQYTTGLSEGVILGSRNFYHLDDAAYANTHLIRVLDWNDTYLSKEPAHPSDNIGALIALSGRNTTPKEFLTALVLAYEIQCRFCDAASLRKNGWDHVAYVALASSLAAAKLLKLNKEKMKQATSLALRWIPLRQVRAGSQLSMSKGLSAAEAVKFGVNAAEMASRGITGPSEILEGQFGFLKQATGELDLSAFESLSEEFKILKTHIKLYPVEYHAQAAIDLALKIRQSANNNPDDIKKIDLVAYEACRTIIADPSKRRPTTKESADHSLFFMMAVAILDGEMTLKQYQPGRFKDPAVLKLIDCMSDVIEDPDFNQKYLDPRKPAFPMLCGVELRSGKKFIVEVSFPKGHWVNPLTDQELIKKFDDLTGDDLTYNKNWLEDRLWNLENYAGSLAELFKNFTK